MKPVTHFLLAAFLCPLATALLPAAVHAQGPSIFEIKRNEEGMPPLSEYENIPPGLMIAPEESSKVDESINASADGNKGTAMPRVEYNYGQCLEMYGQGEYDKIFTSLEILAAGSHRPAEELLGIMYRLGQGTEKNLERAKKLLISAANADNRPVAQHHLGIMYYLGEGGEKNLVESLMWLQLATTLYPDGPERQQAENDRDQVLKNLTRRDRDNAMNMARDWLQKRGLGHLMDMR